MWPQGSRPSRELEASVTARLQCKGSCEGKSTQTLQGGGGRRTPTTGPRTPRSAGHRRWGAGAHGWAVAWELPVCTAQAQVDSATLSTETGTESC